MPGLQTMLHIHYSKSDLDYTLDVNQVFDNLYAGAGDEEKVKKGLCWRQKKLAGRCGGKKTKTRTAGGRPN